MVAGQRWAEVDGAERAVVIGTPQVLIEASTAIDREFYDYYRTPRGQHRARRPHSPARATRRCRCSGPISISTGSRRDLSITGDRAHSRIFSERAFKLASEPKELFIVPNAGHVDLYDRVNLIPWDKLKSFFDQHHAA